MSHETPLINLAAWERAAEAALPRMVYDYYAGGADDERTLRASRAAWESITLRYRVLRDVAERAWHTTILGHALEWPAIVAPMAFQRLATADGEIATARAAGAAGIGMILSTLSTRPIDHVRRATNGPLWFQLYIYRDREVTRALVERAERAGCTALVLTVDTPILGRRERDLLNGFHLPAGIDMPNTGVPFGDALGDAQDASSALARFVSTYWDAGISWRDLDWLRSVTRLPILLKGVVRGDDAALAIEHGVAGVIVSNHGGRQLDGSIPTARALPDVVAAVGDRTTVLVDGGIRRGTDIVKALAMGAHGILLGRPILWGLAVAGEDGAAAVIRQLYAEFDLAMALAGCRRVADATPDLLAP